MSAGAQQGRLAGSRGGLESDILCRGVHQFCHQSQVPLPLWLLTLVVLRNMFSSLGRQEALNCFWIKKGLGTCGTARRGTPGDTDSLMWIVGIEKSRLSF